MQNYARNLDKNNTKRKVTERECRAWIKWLERRGYPGPFDGLTPANTLVKQLARELRKDPKTISETRPRDARTIASNLNKYARKRAKVLEKQPGFLQPNDYQLDHWKRLGNLAEELMIGLEFPHLGEGRFIDSRFGGRVWGAWYVEMEGSKCLKLWFSAQTKKLWDCLVAHLDAEFPSFSKDLADFQLVAAGQVTGSNLYGDKVAIASHPQAGSLRDNLWVVIERGTFKSKCNICEDWES